MKINLNMKINKLKHIIKEHIQFLNEQSLIGCTDPEASNYCEECTITCVTDAPLDQGGTENGCCIYNDTATSSDPCSEFLNYPSELPMGWQNLQFIGYMNPVTTFQQGWCGLMCAWHADGQLGGGMLPMPFGWDISDAMEEQYGFLGNDICSPTPDFCCDQVDWTSVGYEHVNPDSYGDPCNIPWMDQACCEGEGGVPWVSSCANPEMSNGAWCASYCDCCPDSVHFCDSYEAEQYIGDCCRKCADKPNMPEDDFCYPYCQCCLDQDGDGYVDDEFIDKPKPPDFNNNLDIDNDGYVDSVNINKPKKKPIDPQKDRMQTLAKLKK